MTTVEAEGLHSCYVRLLVDAEFKRNCLEAKHFFADMFPGNNGITI